MVHLVNNNNNNNNNNDLSSSNNNKNYMLSGDRCKNTNSAIIYSTYNIESITNTLHFITMKFNGWSLVFSCCVFILFYRLLVVILLVHIIGYLKFESLSKDSLLLRNIWFGNAPLWLVHSTIYKLVVVYPTNSLGLKIPVAFDRRSRIFLKPVIVRLCAFHVICTAHAWRTSTTSSRVVIWIEFRELGVEPP